MKITNEIFEKIEPDRIFAVGVIPNSPEGLYMLRNNYDRLFLWVAKKGGNEDWAIYYNWMDSNSIENVKNFGDKVCSNKDIKKCVNCSDGVLAKYRS